MIRSDASQLRALARELKTAQPAMVRAVRRAVKMEGNKVAQVAAENANWSKRIPGAIKVHSYGLLGVRIFVDPKAVPYAAAYEQEGQERPFRHPLNFKSQGNRKYWVSQDSRPFLHPAALDNVEEIRAGILAAALIAVKGQISKGHV